MIEKQPWPFFSKSAIFKTEYLVIWHLLLLLYAINNLCNYCFLIKNYSLQGHMGNLKFSGKLMSIHMN